MWSLWLAAAAMLLPCSHSKSFSSWPQSQKYLYGASVAERVYDTSVMMCQLFCLLHESCRSFNYHQSGRVCDILEESLCDDDSYYLSPSAGGSSWYDVVDPATQSHLRLWGTPVCANDGRCRDGCLKELEKSCYNSVQCRLAITGTAACVSGKCQCDPDFWPYNQTLCLRKNDRARTEATHWAWKKIANDACYVDFEVKADAGVQFSLHEGYLYETYRYNMHIAVPGDPTNYAERVHPGVSTYTFATKQDNYPLDPLNFQLFKVSWCGGIIQVYRPGIVTFFHWEDPSPIQVTHMAFKGEGARWKFASNVVDPWFGQWSDDRIYQLPR